MSYYNYQSGSWVMLIGCFFSPLSQEIDNMESKQKPEKNVQKRWYTRSLQCRLNWETFCGVILSKRDNNLKPWLEDFVVLLIVVQNQPIIVLETERALGEAWRETYLSRVSRRKIHTHVPKKTSILQHEKINIPMFFSAFRNHWGDIFDCIFFRTVKNMRSTHLWVY